MSQSEGEEEQLNSAYEKRDLIESQRNDLEKRLNNLKSTIQNQDVEFKKQQRLLNEAREIRIRNLADLLCVFSVLFPLFLLAGVAPSPGLWVSYWLRWIGQIGV